MGITCPKEWTRGKCVFSYNLHFTDIFFSSFLDSHKKKRSRISSSDEDNGEDEDK